MKSDIQSDLKLQTKLWLKANNRNYAWLAQRCHVSESTVRNWMARKTIPSIKEIIIRDIIGDTTLRLPGDTPIRVKEETLITLKLTPQSRAILERSAQVQNKTLAEFLAHEFTKLSLS